MHFGGAPGDLAPVLRCAATRGKGREARPEQRQREVRQHPKTEGLEELARRPQVRRGPPRSIGVGPRNVGLGEHLAEPPPVNAAADIARSEERVESAVVAPFVALGAEEPVWKSTGALGHPETWGA